MRTEYVTRHIHISFSNLSCAVWLSPFCVPLFFTSPTRPIHVPLHVQLLLFALYCFFCLSYLHASHSTFLFGLIPPLGHVLRSCFQSQLTFRNLEFQIHQSHLVDNRFQSESSNLNIIINVIMTWDVTALPIDDRRNNLVLGRDIKRVLSSNSIHVENAHVFDFLPPGPRVAGVDTRLDFLPLRSTSLVLAFRLFPAVIPSR
jgi:hypothetical protein